ncbi:MAG: D-alanine--D-alanine ligase [Candidatus Tectomicrobia bacterium]|uniref:D-alanine--D-alanine ligase n=1 Tax=Tectimicrobiota bacterium TaxID=2528274 RepID=A0A932GRX2_UNCTE|nr:D-alanine--D-alanine ligase [Candidatus Tectomicrobia bacterium]
MANPSKKLRVAVFFGGQSGEHEVSKASASSVIATLDPNQYEVLPVYIEPDGQWRWLPSFRGGTFPDPRNESPVVLPADPSCGGLLVLKQKAPPERVPIDVAFPVLHGPRGEDGTIQGLFELAGVPYVGAGVLASAIGMDKAVMKALFQYRNLPNPPFTLVLRHEWQSDPNREQDRIEKALGYPVFVKPANLGSSVGISKAKEQADLKQALELAFQYDRRVVVEKGIDCRELECGVLGNDEPQVSGVAELVPHREFYDYEAKYTEGLTDIIIPAPIPAETSQTVRRLALEAFKAIAATGMARVDFFWEKGTGKIYLNEINTIPGFTATSIYPKLWEASGLSYPRLLDRLIDLALETRGQARAVKIG